MQERLPAMGGLGEGHARHTATTPRRCTPVLRMAHRGWRLFPVRPRTKVPLVSDWPHQATNEESRLQSWFNQFPGCNWGVATGPESGMFVLDVDGENGLGAIVDFEGQGCVFPKTLTTRTARGTHAFLKWPSNGAMIRNSAGSNCPRPGTASEDADPSPRSRRTVRRYHRTAKGCHP